MVSAVNADLNSLSPGLVRLLVAPNVSEALSEIKRRAERSDHSLRIVSEVWDHLPGLTELIDCSVSNLAEIALVLWPGWYGGTRPSSGDEPPELAWERLLAEGPKVADRLRREVSPAWFRAAARRCRAGRLPRVSDFSAASQARQLAMAIEPGDLLLILGIADPDPPPDRLLGLARCAEWLARETAARLLVIAPEVLATASELDAISFDALRWTSAGAWSSVGTEPSRPDEQAYRVWPVLGRPHPYSPGEQRLAKHLADDAMLSGLFQYNVHVSTSRGSRYLVDLLWPEGRVVVEVDGYQHHSSRSSFSSDRHRDYELILSGYLVLRLPHDEVIDDVTLAVEKIRDVVRFRQIAGLPKDITP